MPLIVLTGRNSVGKDTVADIIEGEVFERKIKSITRYNRISLASPLKDMCCHLLGIDIRTLEDLKRSSHPMSVSGQDLPTIRQFMINVARKIKEMSGEMIFVSQAINKLQDQPDTLDIITDVRYPREYDIFRSFESPDTVLIKITRPGLVEIEDEVNIDRFDTDYTIYNDGTLEDLEIKVKSLLQEHFNKLE